MSFTWVELLVVFAIITVLVAVLLPCPRAPYDHPLHTALRGGDAAEAKRLVENGLADVNQHGYWGWTPLHYAAIAGHEDIAVLLISRKANVHGRDTRQATPLHTACLGLRGAREYQVETGPTVGGRCAVAELLLRAGADVNATDRFDETPLHYAARYSSPDVAKLLLLNGAKVNAKDHCLDTPLHVAARKGSLEVVGLLLSSGADVNARNCGGTTPLHCAVDHAVLFSETGSVRILLAHGADPSIADCAGHTPLTYASRRGENEVSVLLINARDPPVSDRPN